VYPLGAQIGFAIAHQIAGFQLWGLKVLYLLADIAALVLLTRILQRLPRSPLWVAVWWWNPLVIEETYNSAHMDILLVPPLLYAVLAAMRHRALPAAIGLAIAVSVKVWPVLLAPPIFWLFRRDPLRMAGACAVFLALCFVCVLPLITVSEAPDDSGFVAYSQRWEMNDALYMVLLWIGDQALQLFGHDAEKQTLHYIARAIAVGIIGIVIAYVLRYRTQPNQLMGSAAAITGALFLVSPTQFPWYYVWILPFLCAAPRPSLLALTVMLPMYFLKFHYAARDNEFFFHYRLVWVEYAPVFFLLGMEAWSAVNTRRGRTNALA